MEKLAFLKIPQALNEKQLYKESLMEPSEDDMVRIIDEESLLNVLQIFKEARPIILNDCYSKEILKYCLTNPRSSPEKVLALPFASCVFQCQSKIFQGVSFDGNSSISRVACILVKETSAGCYDAYYMMVDEYGNQPSLIKSPKYQSLLEAMINIMNDRSHHSYGLEKVDVLSKIRMRGVNHHYRIRKIVHVKPKQNIKNDSYESKTIDWSHRWQVMGHWRRKNGLGKDRNGDYVVDGFTWVVDHEKGPEEKILVKKTRVIEANTLGV